MLYIFWKIGGEGFAENHAACVPRKILGCTEIGPKCAQKVDYDSTFIFQTWPTVFLLCRYLIGTSLLSLSASPSASPKPLLHRRCRVEDLYELKKWKFVM